MYAYSVPESSESIICILYLYTVIQIPFLINQNMTVLTNGRVFWISWTSDASVLLHTLPIKIKIVTYWERITIHARICTNLVHKKNQIIIITYMYLNLLDSCLKKKRLNIKYHTVIICMIEHNWATNTFKRKKKKP